MCLKHSLSLCLSPSLRLRLRLRLSLSLSLSLRLSRARARTPHQEDHCNPSTDPLYEGVVFPMPGPGMFVEMLKNSMPPGTGGGKTFCCGKGGNIGRTFMIDRAIQMLKARGHCGERDRIMVVGDRFDTDVRG